MYNLYNVTEEQLAAMKKALTPELRAALANCKTLADEIREQQEREKQRDQENNG